MDCNDCPYFNSVTDDAMFGTYIDIKKGVFGIQKSYEKRKNIIKQKK